MKGLIKIFLLCGVLLSVQSCRTAYQSPCPKGKYCYHKKSSTYEVLLVKDGEVVRKATIKGPRGKPKTKKNELFDFMILAPSP